MNHSLLVVVLKRAGELAITAKGNPALAISIGISVSVFTIARSIARQRERDHEKNQ